MKKTLFLLLQGICAISIMAQNSIENILIEIEANNHTLQALRQQADADKIGNTTDISLSDPEIGFNYLWGTRGGIGNRQDISVSQRFDIATLSGIKSRVGKEKTNLVEWQYRAHRMDIMLQAHQLLLDVIYCNAMLHELDNLRNMTNALLNNQKQRLDTGRGNMLEYNSVKLELSKTEAEIRRVETERGATLTQLSALNGGKTVQLSQQHFQPALLPSDFEKWYAQASDKNPLLGYVKSEVQLSRRQLKLVQAQNLPSLSVGYMSENTVGERYQGLTLGLSIPLWNNKNRVRQARAGIQAAELREKDAHQQYYGRLLTLYRRTQGLQEVVAIYRQSLEESNNTPLLKKALDMGQISLPDYLMQASIYYDTIQKILSAERDYQKSFAELTAVTTL